MSFGAPPVSSDEGPIADPSFEETKKGQNEMSDKQLEMQAPKGTSAANIEGHEYDVPKSGRIKVVNSNHVETLKRHGFTEVEEVEDIHAKIDELGKNDKADLVEIIEEHGGEADIEMSLKKLRALAHEQVGGEAAGEDD